MRKIKKKFKNFSLIYLLYLFPIIDFVTSYFAWQNINIGIGSIIKGLFLVIITIYLFIKNDKKKLISCFLIYLIIVLGYLLISENSLKEYLNVIFRTFFFPMVLIFFSDYKDEKINDMFLVRIFYMYLLLLIIPKIFGIGHNISEIYPNKEAYLSFFYSGNELSATLLCLMPISLNHIFKCHSILTKIILFALITWGLILLKTKALVGGFIIITIYLIFKSKQKVSKKLLATPIFLLVGLLLALGLVKNFNTAVDYYDIKLENTISIKFVDKVLLSSRITYLDSLNQVYLKSNVDKKIFGLGNLSENNLKDVEMDFFDIFYTIGILGFTIYLILFIYGLRHIKIKGIYAFGFYLTILISFITGHILRSPMPSIWLATLVIASQNKSDKKKILMVSNMYPSSKAKHYGSFVKNMTKELRKMNYDVRLAVMHKHKNIFIKTFSYMIFYLKAFILSLLGSYDYIYVHFISHSTMPVILGYIFSYKTKLILNAHGNDVVKDYNYEEANIKRSAKYIKYADKIVVSSKYFKERIKNDYNYEEDKIVVFPAGGVDLEVFREMDKNKVKEELGLDVNIRYIGTVIRIEKNKGYDTLIEAIYMLKELDYMKNTKLIIIGTGDLQKDLDKLINAYGADRVSEFYMSGLINLSSRNVDYMLSKKKRIHNISKITN